MYLRLNYTDRRKIFHTNDINSFSDKDIIILLKKVNEELSYDIKLNESRIKKFSSANSKFYIEASHRHSFIRYDWGNIGSIKKPEDLVLRNFEADTVKFNVLIVSEKTNRIIASTYGIKPNKDALEGSTKEEQNDKQKSFINFVPDKIDQLWKMRFNVESDDKPEFVFCKESNFKKVLNQQLGLQAVIFPEVFRQTIYFYGVQKLKHRVNSNWGNKILNFADNISGQNIDESYENRDQIEDDDRFKSWVDAAVDAYSVKFNTKDKFKNNFNIEDE